MSLLQGFVAPCLVYSDFMYSICLWACCLSKAQPTEADGGLLATHYSGPNAPRFPNDINVRHQAVFPSFKIHARRQDVQNAHARACGRCQNHGMEVDVVRTMIAKKIKITCKRLKH